MKAILAGLMASALIATPASALSWKNTLFERLDTDVSGELSAKELKDTGCTLNVKFFNYADKDHSKGLSKSEFFNNRDLFKYCK